MRIIYFLFILTILSCQTVSNSEQQNSLKPGEALKSQAHFTIEEIGNSYLIQVNTPFVGADFSEEYILYPKDSMPPKMEGITHFIPYPVQHLAVTSTTHVGFLSAIDGIKYIKAANNIEWVFNSEFHQLYDAGKIAAIGKRELNYESLINQEVDLVLSYAIDAKSYNEVNRLRDLGQQVVLISEFMEQNPLDKAAWLKVIGLLIGKKENADTYLLDLKTQYDSLKEMAQNTTETKTLLMGFPWKGTWYMSGGKSFQAKLFEDANSRYLWAETNNESGMPLNVEEVLNKGLEADVWINTNAMNSLSDIKNADSRFTAFSAYQNKTIYNYSKRINENGGNDYWESGVIHPDWILQDLIKILHPDLLKAKDFIYYQKLE